MTERIVITGTSAVSGAGRDPASMLNAILAGRSAIRPIEGWDTRGWPVTHAAEIPEFNARALVDDRKLHKLIRRTDLVGIYAGDRAAEAAGYSAHRESLSPEASARFADQTGIYVGSGGGAFENQYDYFPLMSEAQGDLVRFGSDLADTVNPMWLLRTLPNNVLCHVGIRNRLKGANACITNHSVGGTLAVIEAMEALRTGEAERALAIGHDTPVEPQNVLYYHACGLLAADGLRPFDAARTGSLFGEGAGAFALETESAARRRAAPIIGEALGGGYTTEASGLLAIRDDGDGLARAIEAAMTNARVSPDAIGMVVAHGNGTSLSDASEALALRRVFGARCPPVTAFKWALGHLIAAAGIVEATIALAALQRKTVPGIATLDRPAVEAAGLPLSRDPQEPGSDTALILCRGFASTDAALIIRSVGA
jgi:3-oxoacyl-[acyl-carrier-protein] synthase-1